MTCKDCLYYSSCNIAYLDPNDICEDFKNKNNFVEVVRCKDCEYCEIGKSGKDYCWLFKIGVYDDDFCSYGEREDT